MKITENTVAHLGGLRREATSLLGLRAGEFNDLLQEVYIKILEKEGDIEVPENLASLMLFEVCQKYNRDEMLHAALERENSETLQEVYGGIQLDNDPFNNVLANEMIEEVMTKLTPLLQQIFTALYINGLSVSELAGKRGSTENSVYFNVYSIKEKFKEHING